MADVQIKRYENGSWDSINPKTTWANVSGKPSTYPPSSHTHTKSQITDFAHTHGNADLTELASWAKQANKPSYNFNEINNRGEAYLEWGGTNRSDDIDPLAMSISAEHSANRIAFLNGDAISMEYSSDGGTTWTDYEYSSNAKSEFCTTTYSVPIGRSSGSTECTTSMRTRITLTGCNGSTTFVYTDPRKLLIRMSTANSVEVDIEYKTGVEGASWQQYGTYRVSGWSGWNSIPLVLGTFGGGTTQYSNNWYLRFTFRITALYESYKRYSDVMAIRLFGTNCWVSSSYVSGKGVMSETGHMYTYDIDGNVTFPKFIQGTFNGQYNKAAFKWRDDGSGYKTGIYYGTAGNECLTFGTNQSYTGIQFINGIDVDNMNSATWQSTTSDLMIKDKKVYINYKYNDGLPDYKLNVNGTANATTLYEGGTALSSKYAPLSNPTFVNGVTVNTNSGANPLLIARNTSIGEGMTIGVNDGEVVFTHTQDEDTANFTFVGAYTDTEQGGGAHAGSHTLKFVSSYSDASLMLDNVKFAKITDINPGTVTSVQVQAGTGLVSSQSTAQTSTLNTTISIDSGYKLPTTTEWNEKSNLIEIISLL